MADRERVECCVPDCRRSISQDRLGDAEFSWEWICPTHWALVPSRMRRAYARVKRRERKFGVKLEAGRRLWRRLKIECGAMPPLGWPGYRTRPPEDD